MPKVISFPIPYDAIALYRCPHGHRSGWEIYAVNHEGGSSVLTLHCRAKNCGYSTAGMFLTDVPLYEETIEE